MREFRLFAVILAVLTVLAGCAEPEIVVIERREREGIDPIHHTTFWFSSPNASGKSLCQIKILERGESFIDGVDELPTEREELISLGKDAMTNWLCVVEKCYFGDYSVGDELEITCPGGIFGDLHILHDGLPEPTVGKCYFTSLHESDGLIIPTIGSAAVIDGESVSYIRGGDYSGMTTLAELEREVAARIPEFVRIACDAGFMGQEDYLAHSVELAQNSGALVLCRVKSRGESYVRGSGELPTTCAEITAAAADTRTQFELVVEKCYIGVLEGETVVASAPGGYFGRYKLRPYETGLPEVGTRCLVALTHEDGGWFMNTTDGIYFDKEDGRLWRMDGGHCGYDSLEDIEIHITEAIK